MTEKQKTPLFTLPQQYVVEIVHDCDEQIMIIEDLLRDIVKEDVVFCNKKAIVPYIAQLIWINHSIIKNINSELNSAVFHFNEDSQEDEVIFTEHSLKDLQAFMLAKWYATLELKNLSCTLELH